MARVLLESGADVNMKLVGTTALHLAAVTGDLELVKLLVDAGATLNAVDDDGMGALKLATEQSHYKGRDIVDYLAAKGATLYGGRQHERMFVQ